MDRVHGNSAGAWGFMVIQKRLAEGKEIGFEDKLWRAADKLRNNMDAAEYKHVVLGLIFLKYISDAFGVLHEKLFSKSFKSQTL